MSASAESILLVLEGVSRLDCEGLARLDGRGRASVRPDDIGVLTWQTGYVLHGVPPRCASVSGVAAHSFRYGIIRV